MGLKHPIIPKYLSQSHNVTKEDREGALVRPQIELNFEGQYTEVDMHQRKGHLNSTEVNFECALSF